MVTQEEIVERLNVLTVGLGEVVTRLVTLEQRFDDLIKHKKGGS